MQLVRPKSKYRKLDLVHINTNVINVTINMKLDLIHINRQDSF